MKKICFLLGGLQGTGGIGRITSELANRLVEKNLEIVLISYFKDNSPFSYNLNKNVKQYVLFNTRFSMTEAIIKHHAIKKVKEIIKTENIDFVIACGALYFPLAILASSFTKSRCICWEHTNPKTGQDYKFQRLSRFFSSFFAFKIVVLTKSAESFYRKYFPFSKKKVVQIYNFISKQSIVSKKYNDSSQKIISVGRLTYAKNFERLLYIASKTLNSFDNWEWDIYGDGEMKSTLQKLILEYKLEDKVFLKGNCNNIYEIYQNYSFLVMTSRYEGFPMVLIEAAANKLPLISFDIETGPNEIIENGKNGYLINHEMDDEMIDKIKSLIINKSIRIGFSNNVIALVDKFSEERIIKQWLEIFGIN